MRKVHVLFHTAETGLTDEDRLVGVFGRRAAAARARARLASKKGFRESPRGFVIDGYTIDKDNWQEGFSWSERGTSRATPDVSTLECLPIDPSPNVFLLEHRRVVGIHESNCLIGLYSSHPKAVSAAFRSSAQPGFRSFPHGFAIYGLALDSVHWNHGFNDNEARTHRLLSCSLPSRLQQEAGS